MVGASFAGLVADRGPGCKTITMYLKFFGLLVVNTSSRRAVGCRTEWCLVLRHIAETAVSINRHALRVMVIAALAWCPILATRPPLVLAQARPAPTVSPSPAAPPVRPNGLPRVRDYQQIPELRDIYFDFGAAIIRPVDAKILDANAAWLRAHPAQLVLIEGHCDSRGATSDKNEFNMDLGERRAQAAMNYLVAQGVHPSRITILSYGEERPLCTTENEDCWRQNRRSRFLVKPR
jgi:peptidoglycan-associated lipoprotein